MSDERDAGDGGPAAPPEPNERNRAPRVTKRYRDERLTVLWYAERCIHNAACIRAQPRVFNPRRRPWIDLSQGEAYAIVEAVRRCPTGALEYVLGDGTTEVPERPPTVQFNPGGPLFVRGACRITDEDGNLVREGTRVALCQCGKTKNPPFCDNSHRAT